MSAASTPFVVILPVKPPGRGKSRLRELPDEQRRALAAAFALDTATAALAANRVSGVLAVTDDHAFARDLAALGAHVIPDGVSGDLNGSLVQAAAEAHRRWPEARSCVLLADLPSLTPEALDAALASVPATGAAFVRDAAGTGTTMYTAPAEEFHPRFGASSAQRHADGGAAELDAAPCLRRDVDELSDLSAAMVIGLGPHTSVVTGRA
jgi:2-phospho-L-lactate guanylyltransferase